jgi:hypothetical protein
MHFYWLTEGKDTNFNDYCLVKTGAYKNRCLSLTHLQVVLQLKFTDNMEDIECSILSYILYGMQLIWKNKFRSKMSIYYFTNIGKSSYVLLYVETC